MSTAALLRISGLVPRWNGPDRPAPLDGEIGPGAITCLVGQHEGLRSAWLRALGAVDPPGEGRVDLAGRLDGDAGPHAWSTLRCRLGFVTRTAPLLSVVSGLRNVVLPALYHRYGNFPGLERRARALIDETGCDADLDLLPSYLTELQRRQLAIARAVILGPSVLMIDTPFGCLAPAARTPIADYLLRWVSQDGHALVVATDDLGFVKRSAARIIHVAGEGCYCFDRWEEYLAADVATVQEELVARRQAMTLFD